MISPATQSHHASPPPPNDRPAPRPAAPQPLPLPPSARPNFKRLAAIAIVLWAGMALTLATRPQNENLTNLSWLLAHQQWLIASEATWQILAQEAPDRAVQAKHCHLLLEIDRLWTHYSGGRYGFSAQQRVWDSLASGSVARSTTAPVTSRPGTLSDRIRQFRQRVGWTPDRASATTSQKPIGAFPTAAPWLTDSYQPWFCDDQSCAPVPAELATAQPSLSVIQLFDHCLAKSNHF